MRSRYRIYDCNKIYFITSTITNWIPVFTSKEYFDIIILSLKFCQEKKNLIIHSYVILDNHFHLICSNEKISNVISSLKMFTAKEILSKLNFDKKTWLLNQLSYWKKDYKTESEHQIWQEGFHPKEILDDQMMKQKIEYVHYNPVKRGFVRKSEDWIYSSAHFYKTGVEEHIRIERIV